MIDIQPDVKVRNTPVFDRTVTERRARPRVVIVGAGFGGLAAARELANADVDVLVINRTNYHGFWPCSTRWRPLDWSRSRLRTPCAQSCAATAMPIFSLLK